MLTNDTYGTYSNPTSYMVGSDITCQMSTEFRLSSTST